MSARLASGAGRRDRQQVCSAPSCWKPAVIVEITDSGEPRKQHAHNRQCTPHTFGGVRATFGGRRGTPESKKRKTAVMLSGLSGLSGVFTHPLPQFGGGGVSSHVRIVRAAANGGGFNG